MLAYSVFTNIVYIMTTVIMSLSKEFISKYLCRSRKYTATCKSIRNSSVQENNFIISTNLKVELNI